MASLSPAQVKKSMKSVPLWKKRARTICRKFEFEGFLGAIAFVNRVARAAQKADHHPDIDIRWDTVTLRLSTHSAGGLTQRDLGLAEAIDSLA